MNGSSPLIFCNCQTAEFARCVNAAARVIRPSDIKKFDHGLSRLMHQKFGLHPGECQLQFGHNVTHSCLHPRQGASVYPTCPTVASRSPKLQHVGVNAPPHVVSWPFRDIVSALIRPRHTSRHWRPTLTAFTVVGHSLSFNALPGDLRDPSVSTATFGQSLKTPVHCLSALLVSRLMRYALLTYLLTVLQMNA